MSLSQALANARNSIPECVAIGLVDVDSGMLLDVQTVDSHPSEVLDLVAAATADLFQGQNVVAIENIFKEKRGIGDKNLHYFQDMLIFSQNLIHVFLRGKQYPNNVIVAVCRGSANTGMVIAKARLQVADIEKNF